MWSKSGFIAAESADFTAEFTSNYALTWFDLARKAELPKASPWSRP